MGIGIGRIRAAAWLAAPLLCSVSTAALAQALNFITFSYPGSNITTVTGIRGNNMTGNFSIPNSGGATGSLLYTLPSLTPAPYPDASSPPINFAGATSATPYGPSFGSATGILRTVGSYKTAANGNGDLGFLYDGANAPGQQLTTLVAPSGPANSPNTINTIAHSTFGNSVVGNFDTRIATGNAFLYNIPTNTFTTINRPGAVSTTAYGVYGNRIAGGSAAGPGLSRAYVLNTDTGVYTTYDAPGTGTVVTHFEGITSGGRANTYNLVADSTDATGAHAWAVHIDENGVATWTELAVPLCGSRTCVTSGNSIYGDTAIGVYVDSNGVTRSYIVTVPGIYNPITNNGTLTMATAGTAAISSNGDDIINNGTILATGTGSVGISSGTYGVVTNNGTITASGSGGVGVQLTGTFGTLLNYGTINAPANGLAIQTGSNAVGTVVFNAGVINGQVVVNAGPYARFENSGWMGITAAGAGVTHQVSGTFAQTSAGTLSFRVAPNGVSDQLQVTGVARLAGTAQAVFQPGTYSPSSYTILTATGGLTGTFSSLATQNLPAFLSANLGYSATSVTLSLQSAMAQLSGLAGNQLAVANVLDYAFNSGAGLNLVSSLYGLSASQIGPALTTLSGSNASVGISTSVTAGGQFAALLSNRAATRQPNVQSAEVAVAGCKGDAQACDPASTWSGPNWSAWGNGFGGAQWLNAEPGTAAPAAQQGVLGGAFGGDYRLGPNTLLGIAVGLSDSNYSVGATGASGRATGFHVGLYGTQEWMGFYLNAAATYSRFDGNNTRVIAGVGTTETAKSNVIANQLAGRVEIGRPIVLNPEEPSRYSFTPFAALQPVQLWTPGYSETSVTASGAPGVFALSYQPQSTTSLPLYLGVQFDAATEIKSRPVSAWLRAAWVHEFLPNRNVTAGFAILPGATFTVDGAKAAYNAARIDMGVKYAVGEQTFLFANGGAELSDRGQTIGGTIGLRFVW
jgi:uncharacterized protein with beta-barrel porin domain